MKVTSRAAAAKRYGSIDLANKSWVGEKTWMALLAIPPELAGKWCVFGDPRAIVKRIYCNKDMHAPLIAALKAVKDRGLQAELKTFDGCFNIRAVRGNNSLSSHAYGLAIDLNAKENGLGAVPKLSAAFVKCFTDQGFDWGGNFSRKDGMHFSYCWEYVAPKTSPLA